MTFHFLVALTGKISTLRTLWACLKKSFQMQYANRACSTFCFITVLCHSLVIFLQPILFLMLDWSPSIQVPLEVYDGWVPPCVGYVRLRFVWPVVHSSWGIFLTEHLLYLLQRNSHPILTCDRSACYYLIIAWATVAVVWSHCWYNSSP